MRSRAPHRPLALALALSLWAAAALARAPEEPAGSPAPTPTDPRAPTPTDPPASSPATPDRATPEPAPSKAPEPVVADPSAGVAAVAPWLGQTILEARLVFDGPYRTEGVEEILEIAPGERLTPFVLDRNILLLYQLGDVENVWVDAAEREAGVILTFHVVPLPIVESVEVSRPLRIVESIRFDRALCLTNRGPGEQELLGMISLRPGHPYRPEDLDRQDGPIKAAYVAAGFGERADDVSVSIEEEPVEGGMRIVVRVDAVCPRLVGAVKFSGVGPDEARELRNLVRLRVGDYYEPAEAEEDRRRILDYFHTSYPYRWCRGASDEDGDGAAIPWLARLARRSCEPVLEGHVGYGDDRLAATVTLSEQRAANNTIALTYKVDKGPRIWIDFFTIGAPAFGPLRGFGYRKIVGLLGTDRRRVIGRTREDLMTLLDLENERQFATGFLEEATDTLEQYYQSQGYDQVRVRVRNATRDREDGLRFVVTIRLGQVLPIHEVRVTGSTFLTEDTFSDLFKESMAQSAPWGVFTETAFAQAPAQVLDYYRSEGFRDAYFGQEPTATVEQGPLGPRVVISANLVEGPRTVVREVRIEGVSSLPSAEVREAITLTVDEPWSSSRARESEQAIASLYRRQGYLDVRVSSTLTEDVSGAQHVAFQVEEGPRHTFGVTLVQGNRRTSDRVIRRELTFVPGEPWDPAEITRVQQRLMGTGVFRGVDVRAIRGDDSRDDLLVSVYERNRLEATTSLGISVDDWLEASLTLAHNNVLGLGHRAALSAELAGMSRSLRFQDLLSLQTFGARVAASTGSKIEVSYSQPYVFGSRFSSTYRLSLFERDFKTNYRLVRNAAAWSLAQQLRPTLQTYTLVQLEQRRPVDAGSLRSDELWEIWAVDREPRYGTSGALGFVYSTRFKGRTANGPGRGFLVSGQVEAVRLYQVEPEETTLGLPEPGEVAEQFGRVSGRATWAEPWLDWLRTEVRLNGGYAYPFSGSDGAVPVEKRFYLGGATTVRGFRLDQIGPVIVDEAAFTGLTGVYTTIPTVGNAFASYTLELTFPLGPAVGALEGWELGVFHDGGNVFWTGESRDTFLDAVSSVYEHYDEASPGPVPGRPEDRCDPIGPLLRTAYGAGLRYQTPVGPLRLDLARNAAPRCFEPSWQLHFSIGLF